MLIGCRELRKVESFSTIKEGDSFSAIQWGSGCTIYPWRLADWVEEICHIAIQLKCTFIHVLCDANDVIDTHARERSVI